MPDPTANPLTASATSAADDTSFFSRDVARQELGKQISDSAQMPLPTPPKEETFPSLPDNPVIDHEAWSKMGTALVAVSAIAGALSHHWNLAGNFLAGAMEGANRQDEEVARERYKQYQMAFNQAYKVQTERDKQYQELLKRRDISINQMMAKYRVMASEDDSQDRLAAARTRNLIEMGRLEIARQKMMYGIAQQNEAASGSLHPSADVPTDYMTDAAVWFVTGKHITGARNKQAQAMQLKAAHALAQEMHMSNTEFATMAGTNEAKTHAQRFFQQRYGQAESADSTMLLNLDLAAQYGKNIPRTNFYLVNKLLMEGKRVTGDKNVLDYATVLNRAATEYARLSTGIFGARGLSDTEQKKWDAAISEFYSASQLEGPGGLMDAIRKEAKDNMYGFRVPIVEYQQDSSKPMTNPNPLVPAPTWEELNHAK